MICDRCARRPGGTLQGRLVGQDVDNLGLGAAVDRRRRGPGSEVRSSSRSRAAPSAAGDGVRPGAGVEPRARRCSCRREVRGSGWPQRPEEILDPRSAPSGVAIGLRASVGVQPAPFRWFLV
jgi:hypothetical protein